ncbi:hypothetical protein NNC19_10920 [Clostridium sp. SHJSY1]|uniref:hypothetical protein n=1 Tax=Clostridium sp. SHJSY1 TaxID=2942483 RepID=UPI002874DD67|nr:hypothetical protein [Clostridium sp. SHJSY1]MDS0526193.1 hypothetical protein [Clostridium sp. SHJSY1]
MNITKGMLAYFIFGLNAVVDSGEVISTSEVNKFVENKTLISWLDSNYKDYWDWTPFVDRYEEAIYNILNNYEIYLDEDSYRKFGIKNNGFLILSSVITQYLIEMKE